MSNTTDNWITGILARLDAGRITQREAMAKAVEYGRQQSAKAPGEAPAPTPEALDLVEDLDILVADACIWAKAPRLSLQEKEADERIQAMKQKIMGRPRSLPPSEGAEKGDGPSPAAREASPRDAIWEDASAGIIGEQAKEIVRLAWENTRLAKIEGAAHALAAKYMQQEGWAIHRIPEFEPLLLYCGYQTAEEQKKLREWEARDYADPNPFLEQSEAAQRHGEANAEPSPSHETSKLPTQGAQVEGQGGEG